MALSVPSSDSSLDNSLLDGSFNITGAFHVSAEVTTAANDEQQWAINVARGRKLLTAMKGSDLEAATLYGLGTTAKSKYDGDLKDEMRKWGWNDNTPKQKATFDKQCDFVAYHKIGRCFAELGLGTKSKGAGGPNECFVAEHWDGPAVKKTIPGVMPKPKNQRYEVCKVMYRVNHPHRSVSCIAADRPSEHRRLPPHRCQRARWRNHGPRPQVARLRRRDALGPRSKYRGTPAYPSCV